MKRVLIVEDERMTRDGILSVLRLWGGSDIDVTALSNGRDALRVIASETEKPFDLLITDVRMPLLGGLELLARLAEAGSAPPSVVLSAHADFRYAQEAIHLGVAEYLLKPVNPDHLIAAVERCLNRAKPAEDVPAIAFENDPLDQGPTVWNPNIKKAVEYLRANFRRESGVRDVADRVGLNPCYFSTLFKSETGFTFSDYLLRLRLRRAKELLLTTDQRVYEIAEEVGYTTARYFAKVFHETEGVTPREYRHRYRK